MAALILLRKEIVIEGLSLGGADAGRYSIVALEQPNGRSELDFREPVQMSLLAGLDFSSVAETIIERVERKGPSRIELLMNVQLRTTAG